MGKKIQNKMGKKSSKIWEKIKIRWEKSLKNLGESSGILWNFVDFFYLGCGMAGAGPLSPLSLIPNFLGVGIFQADFGAKRDQEAPEGEAEEAPSEQGLHQ